MTPRAQSSAIGAILLTAVVVITVATAGVFVFGSIGDDDAVRADLVVIQTNESLAIEHNGGEAVPFSEVTIVVEGDRRSSLEVNESGLVRGDNDDLFEPGERWSKNYPFDPDVAWSIRAFSGESELPVQRKYPDKGVELPGAEPSESLDEPPTVVVDGPGKARVGESVSFTASGSRDPDGGDLTYEWSFGDGSDNATGPSVDHTYSSVGTYDVAVNVTDDEGNSVLQTNQIEIENVPDISGPEVSIAQPNETAVVRGGTTYTVRWSASDQQNANATGVDSVGLEYTLDGGETWQDIEFDGKNDGVFEWDVSEENTTDAKVRVNATDGAGNTAEDTTKSFTIDSDRPAVEDVSPNGSAPTYVRSGENVSVSWNATDDTAGVENVTVRIVNGTTIAEETGLPAEGSENLSIPPDTAANSVGNYSVVVEAVDAVGNNRTAERRNAVVVDNEAPELELRVWDQGEEVCFWIFCAFSEEYNYTWSSSDDSSYEVTMSVTRNGELLDSTEERVGDQSISRSLRRSDFGNPYEFRLTATDSLGNTNCLLVTDESDGNPENGPIQTEPCEGADDGDDTSDVPPTASIDAPGFINVGEPVEFGGSGSTDPDGGSLEYEWSFGDGSGSSAGESPEHTYDRMGTYTVTLTATDDEGDTDTTTEQVNVGYALNAGGPELDAGGRTYVADQGENPYQTEERSWTHQTDEDISDTDFDKHYQTERVGDFGYRVPASEGKYRVTFHFADIGSFERGEFNVIAEDETIIEDIDVNDEVGNYHALSRTETVSVTDGTLNVGLEGEVWYSSDLNGLTIERIGPAEDTEDDGDDDEEAAEDIELTGDAKTSGNSGKASFTVENSGETDATVVAIAINGTDTEATEVSGGDILSADGDSVVGEPIPIDESDSGTRVEFSEDVTVAGDERVEFEFDGFQKPKKNGNGLQKANMKDSSVTLTLYLNDGSQTTVELEFGDD